MALSQRWLTSQFGPDPEATLLYALTMASMGITTEGEWDGYRKCDGMQTLPKRKPARRPAEKNCKQLQLQVTILVTYSSTARCQ
mmetsp:Transcript_25943/g.56942  ORF Transcript_25943/g.56942 Transcript_25943/m.56942 type:complete len:84 (-) Transcript_25943:52-303(-)